MKRNKLMLIVMVLLPWLSAPLLGKKTFNRFWPSAFFICLLIMGESAVAHKKRWWIFFEKFHPKLLGELPLIAGPFFIGSLWILKFTFGEFWKYLFTNAVINFVFAFPGTSLLRRLGLAALIRMKKYQFWGTLVFKAVLMYGFQIVTDRMKGNDTPNSILKRLL